MCTTYCVRQHFVVLSFFIFVRNTKKSEQQESRPSTQTANEFPAVQNKIKKRKTNYVIISGNFFEKATTNLTFGIEHTSAHVEKKTLQ